MAKRLLNAAGTAAVVTVFLGFFVNLCYGTYKLQQQDHKKQLISDFLMACPATGAEFYNEAHLKLCEKAITRYTEEFGND